MIYYSGLLILYYILNNLFLKSYSIYFLCHSNFSSSSSLKHEIYYFNSMPDFKFTFILMVQNVPTIFEIFITRIMYIIFEYIWVNVDFKVSNTYALTILIF